MEQGKTIILRVVTVGDKKDRSDTKKRDKSAARLKNDSTGKGKKCSLA